MIDVCFPRLLAWSNERVGKISTCDYKIVTAYIRKRKASYVPRKMVTLRKVHDLIENQINHKHGQIEGKAIRTVRDRPAECFNHAREYWSVGHKLEKIAIDRSFRVLVHISITTVGSSIHKGDLTK